MKSLFAFLVLSALPASASPPEYVQLEISGGIIVTIPKEWQDHDSPDSRTIRRTPAELAELPQLTASKPDWDYEYSVIIDRILPVSDCIGHFGGRAWGEYGSEGEDVQMRVYRTSLSSEQFVKKVDFFKLDTTDERIEKLLVVRGAKPSKRYNIGRIQYNVFYKKPPYKAGMANLSFYHFPTEKLCFVFFYEGDSFPPRTIPRTMLRNGLVRKLPRTGVQPVGGANSGSAGAPPE